MSVIFVQKLEVYLMMKRFERIEASYTSPTAFYGSSKIVTQVTTYLRDSKGNPIVDSRGHFVTQTTNKVETRPCRFEKREDALVALEERYNKMVSLLNQHKYPPFEECVREVEPVARRVNPDMHGLRLVMFPIV